MKAITQYKYGTPDVLKFEDIDNPVVGDDDVLLRVQAASVNKGDWHLLTGTPRIARLAFGLFRPKQIIPGLDVAGQVEEVGANVTRFKSGDEVFGEVKGSYAEYVCVPEDRIILKPDNLTPEQAAAVPVAAITALQGLRDKGRIQSGHKVLIIGASGGVGTFAVQIARSFGAEVTGVCSPRNVEMVQSIGADHVIDYTRVDFTQGDQKYDLILDIVGNRSLRDYKRVMGPRAIYVAVGGPSSSIGFLARIFKMLLISLFGSQKMVPMLAKQTTEDLVVLRELLEAGKVTPVIDRRYVLSEVPEALRYMGEGHAQGKSVIIM